MLLIQNQHSLFLPFRAKKKDGFTVLAFRFGFYVGTFGLGICFWSPERQKTLLETAFPKGVAMRLGVDNHISGDTESQIGFPSTVFNAQRRNYGAEKLFRSIKNAQCKAKALAAFKRRYPNYKPEPFYGSTSYQKRKGYEALIGKSTKLSDNCGQIGRLRVIAGAPLHWTRISFKDLPSVDAFATDPDAQFSQQIIDWVLEDLLEGVSGPFVAVIERGWHGGNHVHIFHLEGACNLGYSLLIPDDKLAKKAAYIYKKPYWKDGNALAYLLSAYLNGKVPKRVFYKGLGNARTKVVTVGDVEKAMKLPLLEKALASKKNLAHKRKKPNY